MAKRIRDMSISRRKLGKFETFGLIVTFTVLGCGSLQAQEQPTQPVSIGEALTLGSDRQGTVGQIDESGLRIIIDDTEHTLAPLVSHNGRQWNRARLIQSLEQGDFIEYETTNGGGQQTPTLIRVDTVDR
jgi:hypothetical protein